MTPNANRAFLVGIALTTTCLRDAPAFELHTHAWLTHQAFERVMEEQPTLLEDLGFLGLVTGNVKPSFGDDYVEFVPGSDPTPPRRRLDSFERRRMLQVAPTVFPSSVAGWLMAGAIREDDWPGGDNPHDDADASFRFKNHFYDPQRNRALTITSLAVGLPSPRWGIGTADPFNSESRESARRNRFSLADAKEALLRATTLRYSTNQVWLDLPLPDDPIVRSQARDTYWATALRALGGVAHLVQDMGQPQHTRNDSHAGMPFLGHASTFESYVEARAAHVTAFAVGWPKFEVVSIPLQPLPTTLCPQPSECRQYPTPMNFRRYSDFWSTSPGSVGGRGLADYASEGFFSAGTNLGQNDYALPPNSLAAYKPVLKAATRWDGTPASWNGPTGSGTASIRLYTRSVSDGLDAHFSADDVALTSSSAFDEFLRRGQYGETFHLSHLNYAEQANLLVPRAIAFSAGLLRRFFRGRIELSPAGAGVYAIADHAQIGPLDPRLNFNGFDKIRAKLRNATTALTGTASPEPLSRGTIALAVKFRRNLCYQSNLDGEVTNVADVARCRSAIDEIVVSEAIPEVSIPSAASSDPAGGEFTFTFAKPIPINAWDLTLQVIYRGRLGNEDDAMVVSSKDISEPTFITVRNDTDYVAIGDTCYTPQNIASNNALWNALAPVCRADSTSRSVSSACKNIALNIRYIVGAAPHLLHFGWDVGSRSGGRLKPRRFGRIAVLMDQSAPPPWTLVFNNAPFNVPGGTSLQVSPYNVQETAKQSVADMHITSRGVKTWDGVGFLIDGATGNVSTGCANPLDALNAEERVPMTADIQGW